MTSPGKGPERFIAGAVDLGEVKARAEARAEVEKQRQLQARGIGSTAGSSAGNNAPGGAGVPGDGSTSGAAQMTVDVTEANFENDVLKRSMQVPVIVAISSTRSPDSQDIVQNLESMARQANYKWIFANVSADTVPQIVQAFGVRAIPTVIALANGRPLDAREGQQPKERLQGWIDQILQVIGDKLPGIPDADKASFTEMKNPHQTHGWTPLKRPLITATSMLPSPPTTRLSTLSHTTLKPRLRVRTCRSSNECRRCRHPTTRRLN